MTKKGRVNHLDSFDNHKVKYGTVDITENKSIYVNLSTWVTPNDDNLSPDKLVLSINKNIRRYVSQYFNDGIKYIVDTDLRSSGLKPSKKSFMSSDITIFTKTPYNNITEDVSSLCSHIISNVERDYSSLLSFDKAKK